MLQRQFPSAYGLFNTLLLTRGDSSIAASTKGVVQIIHDPQNAHWFTVCTKGCPDNTVDVFCSLHLTPSAAGMKAVTSCIKFAGKEVKFRVKNIVTQSGSSACGLYAIAYVTSILHGQDPVNVRYDQSLMREHLAVCLEKGSLTMFPVQCIRTIRGGTSVIREVMCSLYCVCRVSYVTGDQMVECVRCKSWFHTICIGMSNDQFNEQVEDPRKAYLCTNCHG